MFFSEVALYIVGIILLSFSIKMIKQSKDIEKELEKYEFDNRSSGGVVQFEDFEASESHKRKKRNMANLFLAGMLLLLFALIAIAVAYLGY